MLEPRIKTDDAESTALQMISLQKETDGLQIHQLSGFNLVRSRKIIKFYVEGIENEITTLTLNTLFKLDWKQVVIVNIRSRLYSRKGSNLHDPDKTK